MATIFDIAKACHCTTTTVSKVFNNQGSISEKKKKEILETAKRMKYVRSESARTLASSKKTCNLIGVMLYINDDKSFTHELFSNILNDFRIEMEKNDFDICFIRKLDENSPYEYEDYINAKGIDGVFILSARNNDEKIIKLINSNIPHVGFDLPIAKYNVTSNNEEALAELVDYLVDLGHQNICFVSTGALGVAEDRKRGFIKGIARNNIELKKEMIVAGPFYNEDSAKIATDHALETGFNPSVIIYPDDYTAVSAIPYLRTLNKKVPLNMSICGFDGVKLADIMRPSITTIRQDTKNIGISSAQLLLKQIRNEKIENEKIIVPAKLIKGESTKISD